MKLPNDFNYIAAFLTFSCNLRCGYCINHHGGDLVKGRRMEPQEWIAALSQLPISDTLPVTLQGGEPTVYKGFYDICKYEPLWGKMDLLTNLELDVNEFMWYVSPLVFKRRAPYASIRVSWHIGQNSGKALLDRVRLLLDKDYQVGIWAVDHPDHSKEIKATQLEAQNMGIDFRLKEFLGPHEGKEYGTFRYQDAVNARNLRYCECRTSELLISPDGKIFRCHSDLYANRLPIGDIRNTDNPLVGKWVPCSVYGRCNSCDIKVKTNRFQEGGHSSVMIKNISEVYCENRDYVSDVVNTYGKKDAKQST